ncbi:TetR/AcrR family transcriptional regulator [Actinomadura madurae]|uniref:TetR/AcrR family transcriptional regulator n=1 Tax=Actinomadura madurae TaxID=1993 RepID=UPI0015EE8526|nr:TetR/AcrR family transcriptional regulator [Actinomadura madurae]
MDEHERLDGLRANEERDVLAERVRTVATRLFADLGYDAVSTSMIADAAGVTMREMGELYSSRAALYRDAIGRLAMLWRDQIRMTLKDAKPGADSIIALADEYIDFCLSHPAFPRLVIFRWMSDASDILGIEEEILAPALRGAVDFFRQSAAPEVDAEAALWSLGWVIHGYLQAGFLDTLARPTPPGDPATHDRFRRHLHQLIRMLFVSE